MRAISLVGRVGPVELRLYTVDEPWEVDGNLRDDEDMQWRWTASAPNGITKRGRERGRTHATRIAEMAADRVRAQYNACLLVESPHELAD